MAEKFETITQRLEKIARQKGLEPFAMKSMNWFISKAHSINRADTRKELFKHGKKKNGLPALGRMYFYRYDAKHKDTLPYWDSFPLIFLVGLEETGWLALNIHYLPPKARALLLDKLINLRSNKKYTDSVRLRMTYQLLKNIPKYYLFKPCLKRYLASHVKSRIIEIPFTEWEATIFLPLQQFNKEINSRIWSDSLSK